MGSGFESLAAYQFSPQTRRMVGWGFVSRAPSEPETRIRVTSGEVAARREIAFRLQRRRISPDFR